MGASAALQLPPKVTLALGSRVRLTQNVCLSLGLVKRAMGTVVGFCVLAEEANQPLPPRQQRHAAGCHAAESGDANPPRAVGQVVHLQLGVICHCRR